MARKPVLIIVAFIAGALLVVLAYRTFFNEPDIAEFDNADWSSRTYCRVRCESPFELTVKEIELPENVRRVLKSMDSYAYESDAIALFISRADYVDGTPLSIDGAVRGSMANMELGGECKNLEYRTRNADAGAMQTRIVGGSFLKNGKMADFDARYYLVGTELYQIMCINLQHDENKMIRERIMKSIRVGV